MTGVGSTADRRVTSGHRQTAPVLFRPQQNTELLASRRAPRLKWHPRRGRGQDPLSVSSSRRAVSASQEDATGLDDRTPGRRRTHQTGLDSLLGVHVRLGDPTVSKQRRLASLAEAAAYQGGVSTKTVRRQIARGDITGYKLPGSRLLRVDLNELDELLRPIPTVGGAA